MIVLKRLGRSFASIEGREWALLFLESLGVVAGVLIAFELQEWGAKRSEAAKHRQLMERLFEESEHDVATTRRLRDRLRDLSRDEVQFVTLLSKGECPPDSMWKSVQTVGMLPAFNAPRSVYQELMGAGGLSSIESPATRSAVAGFNSTFDWSESQNDYFRTAIGAEDAVGLSDKRVSLRYDPAAAEPESTTFDRQALCTDHGFRNKMVAAVRNHAVVARYHEGVTDAAIKMCALLGHGLGRDCRPASGGPLAKPDADLASEAIRTSR
jgi:hypothetical protein